MIGSKVIQNIDNNEIDKLEAVIAQLNDTVKCEGEAYQTFFRAVINKRGMDDNQKGGVAGYQISNEGKVVAVQQSSRRVHTGDRQILNLLYLVRESFTRRLSELKEMLDMLTDHLDQAGEKAPAGLCESLTYIEDCLRFFEDDSKGGKNEIHLDDEFQKDWQEPIFVGTLGITKGEKKHDA